ncbi:MAG TPA: hypothetical protein VK832_00945, partial [Burkholderiaceae bacterium]|nr:hypothetical protein [Burkholderiaceae bacterium]
ASAAGQEAAKISPPIKSVDSFFTQSSFMEIFVGRSGYVQDTTRRRFRRECVNICAGILG